MRCYQTLANITAKTLIVLLLVIVIAHVARAEPTVTATPKSKNNSATSLAISKTIRIAVMPFYSADKNMSQLVEESKLLISAQLEDNKEFKIVSKYLVNGIIKNNSIQLAQMYPETPGSSKGEYLNTIAWNSAAQIIISGQIFIPLIATKNNSTPTLKTNPVLILTAESAE